MDLFSLFVFTHENNEIKSPTKINDFTVYLLIGNRKIDVYIYLCRIGKFALYS